MSLHYLGTRAGAELNVAIRFCMMSYSAPHMVCAVFVLVAWSLCNGLRRGWVSRFSVLERPGASMSPVQLLLWKPGFVQEI